MNRESNEKSLGELFKDLSREFQGLIRDEVNLAKTEMAGKASRGINDFRFIALGGAVLYAGLLAIITGIVILLSGFMPSWFAAMIAGLAIGGVGYFMVRKGVSDLKGLELAPRKTISSLREGQKWARNRS